MLLEALFCFYSSEEVISHFSKKEEEIISHEKQKQIIGVIATLPREKSINSYDDLNWVFTNFFVMV